LKVGPLDSICFSIFDFHLIYSNLADFFCTCETLLLLCINVTKQVFINPHTTMFTLNLNSLSNNIFWSLYINYRCLLDLDVKRISLQAGCVTHTQYFRKPIFSCYQRFWASKPILYYCIMTFGNSFESCSPGLSVPKKIIFLVSHDKIIGESL